MQRLVYALTLFFSTGFLWADSKYNMPRGVTPMSQQIFTLHMTVFWICVVIAVVVFGVLLYTLVKHRKSRGVKPSTFHGNTAIEILWAVIPLFILIAMAIPATRVILDIHDTDEPDITIKITGYQWYWEYEYLDHDYNIFSRLATPQAQINNLEEKSEFYLLEVDNELVVPAYTKIRFLLTSNDVIHSWWVPALGIKKDTLPGFIHESWAYINRVGTYHGQCAELCGVGHGFMPIVVKAIPPAEFDQWIEVQKTGGEEAIDVAEWSREDWLARGEELYLRNCAICHRPDGSGMPPAFPALQGSEKIAGPTNEHIDLIVHGVTGTAMQAFGNQLNDVDIAAIINYQRNTWGSGDFVEPDDIAAAR